MLQVTQRYDTCNAIMIDNTSDLTSTNSLYHLTVPLFHTVLVNGVGSYITWSKFNLYMEEKMRFLCVIKKIDTVGLARARAQSSRSTAPAHADTCARLPDEHEGFPAK
eukprot:SAG31_NODE_9750_length_1233_cov_2.618166_2_plen_108_part_00